MKYFGNQLFLKEDEIETLSKEPVLDCTHKEVGDSNQHFERKKSIILFKKNSFNPILHELSHVSLYFRLRVVTSRTSLSSPQPKKNRSAFINISPTHRVTGEELNLLLFAMLSDFR